ncbi:ABC transporter permease subunit [Pseudooceanicola sediminis]|uniref:ABC transporter permease subunit n=1 Tax=Pseudooceanicola sediminis TaxID=2211117 RepID=A0A399JAI1_9RHOB|nr:ABC transporter permease subunit [Pseudooceanicola sediminis]KAA2317302.1 ABC transporter permease subunit [Puniceibacterium sp. HSS470]RII39656.1 ABC transporter permease subunit [Pseudooceanicola sediminis]|tara:strand:+ start:37970 stop:38812 length:843 start_codon:yes stop_codon:yes gene_type:complete
MATRKRKRPASFYVLATLLGAYAVFLYAPMACVYVLSFQGPQGGMSFPMVGWSTHWFQVLFQGTGGQGVGDIPSAFRRSIRLALIVGVLTMIISVSAGMAYRRKFPGANFVFYSAIASMVLPGIFVGFGIALTFNLLGWRVNWFSSGIGAQLTWTLPFGMLIMFIVLGRFNPAYEEAATDLGANARQRFWMVIVPIILPGIIAITMASLTSSYEETARTQLNVGTGNTMPMEITGLLTAATSPVIFAVGTVTTFVSFSLVIASLLIMTRLAKRRSSRTAQ